MPDSPALKSKDRKHLQRARLQQAESAAKDKTAFRRVETYWKNRVDEPDWSLALNAASLKWQGDDYVTWQGHTLRRTKVTVRDSDKHTLHLPDELVDIITFAEMPGLVYMPRLLPPSLQRALVKTSLKEGPLPPNTTSLDPHYDLPKDGLWQAYRRDPHAQIARVVSCSVKAIGGKGGRRQPIELDPVTEHNFDTIRTAERQADLKQQAEFETRLSDKEHEEMASVLDKLRWSCIGIPYHWSTKTYLFESEAPAIPRLISDVCRSLVSTIPWGSLLPSEDAQTWSDSYDPQGGIINFYGPKDALTAHIDHSEAEAVRPLVSVSLGASAIFLVGGPTRDQPPISLYLRSGDVVLMSGPVRRAFHGVPRVLLGEEIDAEDDKEWIEDGYASWVCKRRINLNVRQVYATQIS